MESCFTSVWTSKPCSQKEKNKQKQVAYVFRQSINSQYYVYFSTRDLIKDKKSRKRKTPERGEKKRKKIKGLVLPSLLVAQLVGSHNPEFLINSFQPIKFLHISK